MVFFKRYVTEQLLDHIVTETNRYAQQYIAGNSTIFESNRLAGHCRERNKNISWAPLSHGSIQQVPRKSLLVTDEIFLTPIFKSSDKRKVRVTTELLTLC